MAGLEWQWLPRLSPPTRASAICSAVLPQDSLVKQLRPGGAVCVSQLCQQHRTNRGGGGEGARGSFKVGF